MTKTEQWKKVQEILSQHKASKKLTEALTELLKPKSGGHTNEFPPKLDKDGNIVELYCQWHKQYEPVSEFRKSPKSKSGYHYECNTALKDWHAYGKLIKAKEAETQTILTKLLDGEIEQTEAKELSEQIKQDIEKLKEARKNKINFEDFSL